MHFVPVLWLVLAAGPVKLAAPGLTYVGVDEKAGDAYVDFLSDQLRAQGLEVITKSQISTLLGFERQKMLLGCTEAQQSCVAELAGALGVDGVLSGSLNRTSRGTYVVTLTVVRANNGQTVESQSQRVNDEDALYDFLSRFARDHGRKIASSLASSAQARPAATQVPLSRTPPRTVSPPATRAPPAAATASSGGFHPGWAVAGAGAASLIAGGVVFGLAAGRHGEVFGGDLPLRDRTELQGALNEISSQQTLAMILGAAGLIVGGGGAAWALLGAQPQVSVWSGGANVSFAWELP